MATHNPTPNKIPIHGKYTDSSRIMQKVRVIFMRGEKLSAIEINRLCQTNDARKIISTLRNKEGWNIQDIRQANGCKLYWLASPEYQNPCLISNV